MCALKARAHAAALDANRTMLILSRIGDSDLKDVEKLVADLLLSSRLALVY
jgi:hypothetical protein